MADAAGPDAMRIGAEFCQPMGCDFAEVEFTPDSRADEGGLAETALDIVGSACATLRATLLAERSLSIVAAWWRPTPLLLTITIFENATLGPGRLYHEL